MSGPAWRVDVQFDAAVLSRTVGSPMAKDGGDAGKALLALVAAAKGDDLSKIIALRAPSHAEDAQPDYNTPAENLVRMKNLMKPYLPKQPKINRRQTDQHGYVLVGSRKRRGERSQISLPG